MSNPNENNSNSNENNSQEEWVVNDLMDLQLVGEEVGECEWYNLLSDDHMHRDDDQLALLRNRRGQYCLLVGGRGELGSRHVLVDSQNGRRSRGWELVNLLPYSEASLSLVHQLLGEDEVQAYNLD